jgi:hypothetical protein
MNTLRSRKRRGCFAAGFPVNERQLVKALVDQRRLNPLQVAIYGDVVRVLAGEQ